MSMSTGVLSLLAESIILAIAQSPAIGLYSASTIALGQRFMTSSNWESLRQMMLRHGEALSGSNATKSEVADEVVSDKQRNEKDPDFDEIEDLRICGNLFYKPDKDSKDICDNIYFRKSLGSNLGTRSATF
ncbi:hypothetical protein LguiB_014382 [Lonicera macranthoides]